MPARVVRFLTLSLCSLPMLLLISIAQTTAQGSIDGAVVGANGEAIVGAQVTLTATALEASSLPGLFGSATVHSVSTTGSGRFLFTNIGIGSYRIYVRAPGFAPQEYGARGPNSFGIPVSLKGNSDSVKDLLIRLAPTAIVSGRLLNEARVPASNVPVRLLRPAEGMIAPAYQPVVATTTDDRGEYRLFAIPPGRYYLAIGDNASKGENASKAGLNSVSAGTNLSPILTEYPIQFYPGVNEPNHAVPLEITPGSNLRFDMDVRGRRTPYRIRGTVIDAESGNAPRDNVSLSLVIPAVVLGTNDSLNAGSYDSISGRFEFLAPAGSYVVQAQIRVLDQLARTGGEATWSMFPTARTQITVLDSDVENVRLTLKRPAIVPGRVTVQGEVVPKTALRFELIPTTAIPAAWQPPSSQVTSDGTFSFIGMVDGEYLLRAQGVPRGFRIKSIQYGGGDILNQPWRFSNPSSGTVEVILDRETAEVTGVVTNTRKEAVPGQVALVPEARNRIDLYRVFSSDQAGRFTFTDIPFGNYKLFAWEDLDVGAYLDPSFLKVFEDRGTLINIRDSSSRSVELRVIPAP